MSYVWAEFDNEFDRPIRIFRYQSQAMKNPGWDSGHVRLSSFKYAVETIRRYVFQRDEYACVHCGDMVTWESGEMHERQPRGQIRQTDDGEYRGGEISVENSETRCHNCHTGIGGAHNRNPIWSSFAT